MRILFRLIVFLLIIALVGAWLLLPKSTNVNTSHKLFGPSSRIFTFVENEKEWNKWWPGQPGQTPPFHYNGYDYRIGRHSENIVEFLIIKGDKQYTGNLLFAGAGGDTTLANWTMPLHSGNNPYNRLRNYFAAKSLKQDMDTVLAHLNRFVSKDENIYGMQVKRERVKDTVLVVTRANFPEYPSTEQIYTLVNKLRNYIASQNATETNAPMLHVLKSDREYEIMVGIPTDRALKGNDEIQLKRLVPGYILHGEVKGGNAAVNEGFAQLENYRYDKRLASPAIPFALLITDRVRETDSTKWITGLYYPVF